MESLEESPDRRGVRRLPAAARPEGRPPRVRLRESVLCFFLAKPPLWGIIASPSLSLPACYNSRMAAPQAVHLLRQLPLLRGLNEAELQAIAGSLRVRQLSPGELLIAAGDPVEALCLIAVGSLEILPPSTPDQPQPISPTSTLQPGDLLGAHQVLDRLPQPQACRAGAPTEVYLWRRNLLAAFLEAHPGLEAELRFTGRVEEGARRLNLDWMRSDERPLAAGRRHPYAFWRSLVLPAFLLLVLFFVLAAALGLGAAWAGWGTGALAVLALAASAWKWIDWRNDGYVLTNQRVVWTEKVVALYDSRVEAPLHTLLALDIHSTVAGRWFGFGDLIIRTYTGQVTLPSVAHPQLLALMLEDGWRRQREHQNRIEREAMARGLTARQETPPGSAPSHLGSGAAEQRAAHAVGLDRWSLEMRFVEGGVITYRKHWAVLLRDLFWPGALLALSLGLIGLRLAGAWAFLPAGLTLLGLAALVIAAAGWAAYELADWTNDVYQISSSHILSIHKKPLGDEERQVAALDNILGTEVDRKGVIGQLLNFGNVTVNVGATQLTFEGVFHPIGAQQDIVRAQEALIQRKRGVELGQRRDEMIELIHLYDQRKSSPGEPPGAEEPRSDADP